MHNQEQFVICVKFYAGWKYASSFLFNKGAHKFHKWKVRDRDFIGGRYCSSN